MSEIGTPRLRIRTLTIAEAPAVHALITERISRWTAPIPWPHELAHAEWWLTHSSPEKRQGIYLDGTLIGTMSIPVADGEEVGFWINGRFEGQGYATEAAAAIVNHAFAVMGLNLIESMVHRDNIGSRRVHEKLGFSIIGEAESFWRNRNAHVPVVHYRLERPR